MDEIVNKTDSTGLPMNQQAGTIYNMGHIKNYSPINKFFIMPSNALPGSPEYHPTEVIFSYNFYNLIVYEDDPGVFSQQGHILLTKDQCLVDERFISPELKKKFSPLTQENIEELKGFLCIFASENKQNGETDNSHYASVGFLTDIKIRSNGIELYYQPRFSISQKRLNEVLNTFGICGKHRKWNELNQTHWSIKAIDLREALHDTGLDQLF